MCVASISHLGFLAATWVLDPSLLHLFMQDLSIIDLCTNLGSPSIGPRTWIRQAHFMEIRQPRFLPSLVAPSPHGFVIFEWKDLWGDGSRFRG